MVYKQCYPLMSRLIRAVSSGSLLVSTPDLMMEITRKWLQENHTHVDKIVFCVDSADREVIHYMHAYFPVSHTAVPKPPTLPAEILRMDNKSIQLYKKALSEGETSVHSIRVMVVGHYGVGKTTLTKRLLEEDVDLDARDSTDGIDVHVRRCRVSLADKKWTVLKKDEKEESVFKKLAQVLSKLSPVEEDVDVRFDDRFLYEDIDDIGSLYEDSDDSSTGTIYENADVISSLSEDDTDAEYPDDEVTVPKTAEDADADADTAEVGSTIPKTPVEADATEKPAEGDTDKNAIMKDLTEVISNYKSKDNDYAYVSLWDFAGQSVFYNTHQSFLSSRAVYLLVTDIRKHINDVVDGDICYFNSKGAELLKIYEYFNLWLNSIHALCPPGKKGVPPAILVATHADKLDQVSVQEALTPVPEDSSVQTSRRRGVGTEQENEPPIASQAAVVERKTSIKKTLQTSQHMSKKEKKWYSRLRGRRTAEEQTSQPDTSITSETEATIAQSKKKKEKKWYSRLRGRRTAEEQTSQPDTSITSETSQPDTSATSITSEPEATVEQSEQETKYFKAVRDTFNERITAAHVVYTDFAINNAIVDPNLARLQQEIYKVAAQQDYWGEKIPAKWLTLERALDELRDTMHQIITRDKLRDVNKSMPVPIAKEEYLDLFLRFHHDTANILYFNDPDLRDYIVLDPQWLIDGLKSLITADMFRSEDPQIVTQWKELRRDGILTHKLIDAVWNREGMQKFLDHKDHLLQLMKKLNLIAQIDEQTHDGDYLVPGMLTKAPADPPKKDDYNSTSDLCITTSDNFLPVGVFQRLLAGCVSNPKWKILRQDGSYLIYCGYGCFEIDTVHRMTLYFSACTIQMWVSYLGTKLPGPNPELCAEVREYVLQTLQKINTCLSLSQNLELSIKCPDIHELDELPVDGMFMIDGHVMRDSVDDEISCRACAKGHAVCCSDMLRHWYGERIKSDSDDSTTSLAGISGMEEAHRSILCRHRTDIIKNVANPLDVVEGLFVRDIFTECMKQEVKAELTPIEQVEHILDILPHRGPYAFDAFSHVLLETKNEWLVDSMRPGWKDTQPNPDVGLPGERGRAIQQPAVDLPEDWPNEEAMTAQVIVEPCGVHSQLVEDYWNSPAAYSMKKRCRGRCVIISNRVFSGPLEEVDGVLQVVLPTRHGTDKDVDNLVELFKQLHFDVVDPHIDKTAEQMSKVLRDEALHPAHNDAECFVCIICSHGTTTGIYGTDGEVISLETIISLFDGKKCPALRSKPKLIFIQACQGEETDRFGQIIENLLPQKEILNVGDTRHEADNIPTKADMLVACATHPGYISLRHIHFGSWFIQAVICVFQRHAHKEDILSLLTLVNNLVSRGRTDDNIMQAPVIRTSLVKKLYFFPEVIQELDS